MNKLLISLMLVVGVVNLTGCAGINKYAQDRFNPLQSAKEECASMGLKFGTPEYANCVSNLYASKQNVNAARAIAGAQAANNASQAAQMNRIQTTNCNRVGSSLSCTTF